MSCSLTDGFAEKSYIDTVLQGLHAVASGSAADECNAAMASGTSLPPIVGEHVVQRIVVGREYKQRSEQEVGPVVAARLKKRRDRAKAKRMGQALAQAVAMQLPSVAQPPPLEPNPGTMVETSTSAPHTSTTAIAVENPPSPPLHNPSPVHNPAADTADYQAASADTANEDDRDGDVVDEDAHDGNDEDVECDATTTLVSISASTTTSSAAYTRASKARASNRHASTSTSSAVYTRASTRASNCHASTASTSTSTIADTCIPVIPSPPTSSPHLCMARKHDMYKALTADMLAMLANHVYLSEPPGLWGDDGTGTIELALPANILTDERIKMLTSVIRRSRNSDGGVKAENGVMIYPYQTYENTVQVLSGAEHNKYEQRKHVLALDPLESACKGMPGLKDILDGLKKAIGKARALHDYMSRHGMKGPMFGHTLDNASSSASFAAHDDTLDNCRERRLAWWYVKGRGGISVSPELKQKLRSAKWFGEAEVQDRDVKVTAIIPLTLGDRSLGLKGTGVADIGHDKCQGPASMRVAGHVPAVYKVGHVRIFPSRVPHWTEHAMAGDVKIALFHGQWVSWQAEDENPGRSRDKTMS